MSVLFLPLTPPCTRGKRKERNDTREGRERIKKEIFFRFISRLRIKKCERQKEEGKGRGERKRKGVNVIDRFPPPSPFPLPSPPYILTPLDVLTLMKHFAFNHRYLQLPFANMAASRANGFYGGLIFFGVTGTSDHLRGFACFICLSFALLLPLLVEVVVVGVEGIEVVVILVVVVVIVVGAVMRMVAVVKVTESNNRSNTHIFVFIFFMHMV